MIGVPVRPGAREALFKSAALARSNMPHQECLAAVMLRDTAEGRTKRAPL